MANSFSDLLKARKKSKAKLSEKISNLNKKGPEPDARFWTHQHCVNEKTKTGYAKIRFLPAPIGEEDPFVEVFGYFERPRNTQSFYIHNSHKTFDPEAEDPAYEYNGTIFEKYKDPEERKGKTLRRQKKYFANILVIDDPVKPENNGKVFLYEFGPQIMEKIKEAGSFNEEAGETEDDIVNVFDPIDGAVFHLKMTPKKIGKDKIYVYETSTFLEPSQLAETEEEMAKIWEMCTPLFEFVDPNNEKMFASIEKQRADFAKWLGTTKSAGKAEEEPELDEDEENDDEDLADTIGGDEDDTDPPFDTDEDDDDDFFEQLKQK